ncbi:MAG: fatty acid-binding protein DegV, partial [Lachnospiraceae bacterium]|nr:fatty acid-binding protein DegV [Lachnospiraceae bacterium]
MGADIRVLYPLLAMCFVNALAIWIAVERRNIKLASWLVVTVNNMILFPIVFIMSGGIQSGTAIWFVLGLVYIFLLFDGKSFLPALSLSVLSFLLTYLVSYYNPMILSDSSRFYSFIDSFITLLCVSCFIGILLKSQARTYERERQIAEAQKREVEQIARSKDTFFANMSHEIRTPINTIIGLNEMILREDISDEIAENAINIQNASKMLLTTINDILDLSKLESGKMDIVPTQYEISSMFSDLVNLVWIRAHQKELEFKVDIDPEIPSMLYGDEVRIKQVVTNLLTNAVKYTQAGSVTLTAKGERIAADQILLRISVQDTGMGIRKESLDDLFSSFKRVDETDNRNI